MGNNKETYAIKLLELENDFLKHVATLDTAAVVIIATFFDKATVQPNSKFWIISALIAFIVSILSVLFGQLLLVILNTRDLEKEEISMRGTRGFFMFFFEVLAFMGLGIGLIALVSFVFSNLP